MEYVLLLTGFTRRNRSRHIEDQYIANVIDPMLIDIELRDVYSKMGLNRWYIGDGYPLCSDIPKGCLLRHIDLTTTLVPEIYIDPIVWYTDPMAKRFKVVGYGGSSLFSKLCGSQNQAVCDISIDYEACS
jgi:hypothetical protein